MKKRIFISAIYTSPVDSMGGNTKIIIEMINNTIDIYSYVILTSKPETFYKNIIQSEKITIIPIHFPYIRNNRKTHIQEISYIYHMYTKHLTNLSVSKDDICITQSDFAPDVVPIYLLQKKLGFIWIPTLFLFIPNPINNGMQGYFPFIKYTIYRFYQKCMFLLMQRRGTGFIITNHADLIHFSKNQKVLPLYGGVNIEQIQPLTKNKIYDAVFCGRLHPQKGVSGLLQIWRKVVDILPNAKLAIIGNGSQSYENQLHKQSRKLGLVGNIDRLGYVNNNEKYVLYSKSRMLLHTSVYDNNGMVAAEALCQGLPVIMYDLPSLKEVYTDGCYKIKYGDKLAYAKQIITLIDLNVALSPEYTLRFQQQWSWEIKAKEFTEFINQFVLK